MAEETVEEFLVAVGWKSNENDYSKFERMIEGATLRAKLLGDALEEMARKGIEGVQGTAEKYENLFFAAERMHMNVQDIQAFEYAVSQVGGTSGGALTILQQVAAVFQKNPNSITVLNHIGFEVDKVTGKLQFNAELVKKNMALEKDSVSIQWGHDAGLSDDQTMMIKRYAPEMAKHQQELKNAQARMGVNPEENAEKAEKFKSKWNEALMNIRTLWEDTYAKFAGYMTGPLESFNKFLAGHEGQIKEILKALVEQFGLLIGDAVKLFEDWVNKPTTKADIENFFKNAKNVVDGFGSVLKFTVEQFAKLVSLLAGSSSKKENDAAKAGREKAEREKAERENASGGKSKPDEDFDPEAGIYGNGGESGSKKLFRSIYETVIKAIKREESWFGVGSAMADTLDTGTIKTDGVKVGSGNPLPVKVDKGAGGASLTERLMGALGLGGGAGGGAGGGGLMGRPGAGFGGGGLMGRPGAGFGGKRGGWGETSDQQIIDALARAERDGGAPAGQLRGIYAGEGRGGFVGDNGTSFNWGQFHLTPSGRSMGNEMQRDGVDIMDRSPEGIYKTGMWVAKMLRRQPGRISEFHGNRGAGVGLRLTPSPPPPAHPGAATLLPAGSTPKPASVLFRPLPPSIFKPTAPTAKPVEPATPTSFNQNVKVNVAGGGSESVPAIGSGPRNMASDMTRQFNSAVG